MAKSKEYGATETYEKKLERVMERFGVESLDYDFSRREAWINFSYKGTRHHFSLSVEQTQGTKRQLAYGSDCFARLVLALEDIARMVEDGVYDLGTWMAGMKMLPESKTLMEWCQVLKFEQIPDHVSEIESRFKELVQTGHPDKGGSGELLKALIQARKEGHAWFEERRI